MKKESLIKKVKSFSKRFDLWKEGSKIVVGVSGGPDSTCLLDVLSRLKDKYNLDILVAHVNYGLRGDESIEDEKFIEELAKKSELKIKKINLNSLKINDSNLENELRDIRYDFFEKIRKENNFDVIAVAHNKDDQAETVLMRLIRGAGLQGLGSIRPKNKKIIRPLLRISRKEILAYLENNNLNYRIDKTNEDVRFFRNKIRHNLIPYLEEDYNPAAKETLAGVAEAIADDYSFINSESKKILDRICTVNEGDIEIRVSDIVSLHHALQKQVLRQAITSVKKNLVNVEGAHIEEIIKIIKSHKNKSHKTSFKGLKVLRKGDIIRISVQ